MGTILKNKQNNKSACIKKIIRLIIMKMKMKMKKVGASKNYLTF